MSKPDRGSVVPGDITVTLVYAGYIIGRILPARGSAPGWEYIQVVATKGEAVAIAQQLAAENYVTAAALVFRHV